MQNRGLRLVRNENAYIIEQSRPIEFHTYKFKNIETPDISGIFSVVDNSTFAYIPISHSVIYKANSIQHIKIREFLKQIDVPLSSETIKVSIIRTDLNKLVQIGSKIGKFELGINDFANYIFGIAGDTTSLQGGHIFDFKTILFTSK
ncbi:MAG: hypothetical protein LBG21_01270 [Campylobacteraceae bacterium]|nr:hypothetical protein [Campylobacteraceae bacterium]